MACCLAQGRLYFHLYLKAVYYVILSILLLIPLYYVEISSSLLSLGNYYASNYR